MAGAGLRVELFSNLLALSKLAMGNLGRLLGHITYPNQCMELDQEKTLPAKKIAKVLKTLESWL